MIKFFAFILILCSISCGVSSNKETTKNNYTYNAAYHNSNLDHQMGVIIQGYQELLKGLSSQDTLYIHQSAKQLVQLTDSIQNIKIETDSTIQKIWIEGLSNLNAELQALAIISKEPNLTETKMSIHMCSLLLLNLLGQIGYKEHQVYIFESQNPNSEDAYVWMGLQKISKNPYASENRKEVMAASVLQETK